jgi:hypothetical protein
MRIFLFGALAAVTLSLCVSSDASADWRYRSRFRFENGRRIVYRERYWAAPVVTTPVALVDAPLVVDPVDVVPIAPPSYFFGDFRGFPYRYDRSFYNHRHPYRR